MKTRQLSIIGLLFLIGGFIVLIIASHYNFGTCPPLPEGGYCDNSVGTITVTVGVIMLLLGIGLFIVAIQKEKFQLK